MARLRKKERDFCAEKCIPELRLFDGTGLMPARYGPAMHVEEKWAAFGVNECIRGHRLRDRHGNCLMCSPFSLNRLLQSKKGGFLYVASGNAGALMKLGFSGNPQNRIKIANYEGWGGYSDWCLRAYAYSSEAGQIEHELHAAFADRHVPLTWERNWVETVTREAFEIAIEEAISKLVWLCDSPPEIVPPPWH